MRVFWLVLPGASKGAAWSTKLLTIDSAVGEWLARLLECPRIRGKRQLADDQE